MAQNFRDEMKNEYHVQHDILIHLGGHKTTTTQKNTTADPNKSTMELPVAAVPEEEIGTVQGSDVATTSEVAGIATLRLSNGQPQLKLIETTTALASNVVVLNNVYGEWTPPSSLEIFDTDGDAVIAETFSGIGIGYFIRYDGKRFQCTESLPPVLQEQPRVVTRPPVQPPHLEKVAEQQQVRFLL